MMQLEALDSNVENNMPKEIIPFLLYLFWHSTLAITFNVSIQIHYL